MGWGVVMAVDDFLDFHAGTFPPVGLYVRSRRITWKMENILILNRLNIFVYLIICVKGIFNYD